MYNILIVDDESITQLFLEHILIKMGYQVCEKLNSGPECIEFLESGVRPDLIFMDINMPGEYDGIQAAKIIEEKFNIPVIFITAYSYDYVLKEIQSITPYGYITKPFKDIELKAAIDIALYRIKMEKSLKNAINKYKEQLENETLIYNLLFDINLYIDPFDKINNIIDTIKNFLNLSYIFLFEKNNNIFNLINDNNNQIINYFKSFSIDDISYDFKPYLYKKFYSSNFLKYPEKIYNFLSANNIKSIIFQPIYINENYYGFMVFCNNQRKYFNNNQLNLIKIITNIISIIVKKHLDYINLKKAEEEKFINEKMRLRNERLSALGELTGAITHEIFQPLQSIKILTDSIIYWNKENKKIPYEELIEHFEKISDRVLKVEKIIKNIKSMLKTPENIELKKININNSINNIVDFFSEKLARHKIKLIKNFKSDLSEILFSELHLEIIIVNIITNAINALDIILIDNKYIEIETDEDKNFIFIIIKDNGPGIPDHIKDKIFNPLFSTYHKPESTGMGLYIVNNILKTYNSLIEVSDNEKNGAVFTIKLNKINNY